MSLSTHTYTENHTYEYFFLVAFIVSVILIFLAYRTTDDCCCRRRWYRCCNNNSDTNGDADDDDDDIFFEDDVERQRQYSKQHQHHHHHKNQSSSLSTSVTTSSGYNYHNHLYGYHHDNDHDFPHSHHHKYSNSKGGRTSRVNSGMTSTHRQSCDTNVAAATVTATTTTDKIPSSKTIERTATTPTNAQNDDRHNHNRGRYPHHRSYYSASTSRSRTIKGSNDKASDVAVAVVIEEKKDRTEQPCRTTTEVVATAVGTQSLPRSQLPSYDNNSNGVDNIQIHGRRLSGDGSNNEPVTATSNSDCSSSKRMVNEKDVVAVGAGVDEEVLTTTGDHEAEVVEYDDDDSNNKKKRKDNRVLNDVPQDPNDMNTAAASGTERRTEEQEGKHGSEEGVGVEVVEGRRMRPRLRSSGILNNEDEDESSLYYTGYYPSQRLTRTRRR